MPFTRIVQFGSAMSYKIWNFELGILSFQLITCTVDKSQLLRHKNVILKKRLILSVPIAVEAPPPKQSDESVAVFSDNVAMKTTTKPLHTPFLGNEFRISFRDFGLQVFFLFGLTHLSVFSILYISYSNHVPVCIDQN